MKIDVLQLGLGFLVLSAICVASPHGASAQAPTIAIASPLDAVVLRTARPTISGTVTGPDAANAMVELTLGTSSVSLMTDMSGLWMYTPPEPLPQGLLTIRAAAGEAMTMVQVTIDSLTTVTIDVPTEGAAVTTLTPTISGTIERDAQLSLTLDGVALQGFNVNLTMWNVMPAPLRGGAHVVVAMAMDQNGNQATAVRNFTVDRTRIDQDMDGVSDAIECDTSPCRDSDMDGVADYIDPDDDNDQIPTSSECPALPCRDTDADGTSDYRDPDDDNDGVASIEELFQQRTRDTDRDSIPDHLDTDDDSDSLPTRDECGATCPDSDGDGRPDHLDADDDNDEIPTLRELVDVPTFGNDVDGDGRVNWRDDDADNDGIRDGADGLEDSDEDGRPNYLDDLDSPLATDGGVSVGDGGVTDPDAGGIDPRVGVSGGGVLDCAAGSPRRRGSPTFLALLLSAAWLVARRRTRGWAPCGGAVLLALALVAPSTAHAQDVRGRFTLNQFRAAETPHDGFALSGGLGMAHLEFGARLVLDYAYAPLVIEDVSGDGSTQSSALVEHSMIGNLALSIGLFDYFTVFLGMPVTLFSEGGDSRLDLRADGTSVGDFYVGVRGRIWGQATDIATISLQAAMSAPSSPESSHFSGESTAAFLPRLVVELRPHEVLDIVVNMGARVRETAELRNLIVGHELTYGLGLRVEAVPGLLDVHGELWGATGFANAFERATSPAEFLVGARLEPLCGLRAGAGIGMGMGRGYGAPGTRAVLEVSYSSEPHCGESHEEPADSRPARSITDGDGDGVSDRRDRCVDDPEDPDGFQDEDGCPDNDNDHDGIDDAHDGAPNQPEDVDGFEDEDGVPDPDNDGDGIEDSRDVAPDRAEDLDGYQDQDGAPEPDNDLDDVADEQDRCPNTPGPLEFQGCPELAHLEASGRIVLGNPVTFGARGALARSSLASLAEVAQLLRDHGRWTLWLMGRYRGGADPSADEPNRRDGASRIRTIRDWLAEQQVAAERLSGWLCPSDREELEFQLAADAAPEGCTPLE